MRPAVARTPTGASTITTTAHAAALSRPSRPQLHRSATTTDLLRNTAEGSAATRSLLRRAADTIRKTFDLSDENSAAYKNRPGAPTYWSETLHRKPLVVFWDSLVEDSDHANSSTAEQVSALTTKMVHVFGELDHGEVKLTTKFAEWVLGMSNRQPFCAGMGMSKAQVLAESAGTRGNWGPW